MIEVLASRADAGGGVPDEVPLRDLGERVVALYWPQVRAYDGLDRTAFVLRQISDRTKGSVILAAVQRLYEDAARITEPLVRSLICRSTKAVRSRPS